MNIIILILAGITAYILTCLFKIADYYIAKWEMHQAEKKRYSNELYAFKVKKVLNYAYNIGLEQGLSPRQARKMAYQYTHDVENAFMVNVKYEMIRGLKNEYRRTQSSC